jgi:hypothetical protein
MLIAIHACVFIALNYFYHSLHQIILASFSLLMGVLSHSGILVRCACFGTGLLRLLEHFLIIQYSHYVVNLRYH